MPEYSIIVPLYNQGCFLGDALGSLQRQTVRDWEAVVVNDGSTDDSGAVAERLADGEGRVRVIHRANGGLAAARNTGLDHAGGRYILFLDSDDVLVPRALEWMGEAAGVAGGSLVYGRHRIVDERLEPSGRQRADTSPGVADRLTAELAGRDPMRRLAFSNFVLVFCVLWPAERLGEARFDPELRSNEDWEWMIRAAEAGQRFCMLPRVTGWYRRHGDSLNLNFERMWRTRQVVWRRHLKEHSDPVVRAAGWVAHGAICEWKKAPPEWYCADFAGVTDAEVRESMRLLECDPAVARWAVMTFLGIVRRYREQNWRPDRGNSPTDGAFQRGMGWFLRRNPVAVASVAGAWGIEKLANKMIGL